MSGNPFAGVVFAVIVEFGQPIKDERIAVANAPTYRGRQRSNP